MMTLNTTAAMAQDPPVLLAGHFSSGSGSLDDWSPKIFVKETRYNLVDLEGQTALKAVSRQSASGLIKKIRVDLDQYPYLNWTWRIEQPLKGDFNEKEKGGDDYAARIYVVLSGGFAIWNTKALNYVWAKHADTNDVWPNAFAPKNAKMIAVRSGHDPVSTWVTEKRDIQADFKAIFGKEVSAIDAVVLMTDTDNTRNEAVAHYGDIFFSSE
ncbi:MAG: DUF3047 domain-containing protein [Desulfobacteraceae bacterium]|nr:MAG: DUF3047 domain-containing protein [Desulfobacteraceae bacterium]